MPCTPSAFRRLALALPQVEERQHMNHPDFRVSGKIFATLAYPTKSFAMVNLTPTQQQDFVTADPQSFQPVPGGCGRGGSTHVILARASQRIVAEALLVAWRNRAPKHLAFDSLKPKPKSRTSAKLRKK